MYTSAEQWRNVLDLHSGTSRYMMVDIKQFSIGIFLAWKLEENNCKEKIFFFVCVKIGSNNL